MLYKIEISELTENPDNSYYPKEKRVYEQIIENLPVDKIVLFVNNGDGSYSQRIEVAEQELEELRKRILNK